MVTVESLIKETANKFNESNLTFGHGTDNAIDEAAYLIFGYLDLNHDKAEEAYQKTISNEDLIEIDKLIDCRINQNRPVAYLINKAWFVGLEFFVDERVLVPRSPLAELIANKLRPWADDKLVTRALDMGTGSGCIAIALGKFFPDIEIDAIDYSPEALQVANINLEYHKMTDRINLIESDFFSNLPEYQYSNYYDLIISNPPYVDQEDINNMAPEFHHEPILGLASGKDGLESVKILLRESCKYLRDNGLLIVEVGNSRQALEEFYPTLPFIWIDFMLGGEGVFLLMKSDLVAHMEILNK